MKRLLAYLFLVLGLLWCNISFALTQQEAIDKFLSNRKLDAIEGVWHFLESSRFTYKKGQTILYYKSGDTYQFYDLQMSRYDPGRIQKDSDNYYYGTGVVFSLDKPDDLFWGKNVVELNGNFATWSLSFTDSPTLRVNMEKIWPRDLASYNAKFDKNTETIDTTKVDKNTVVIDTTKVKELFKNLTGKFLKKNEAKIFLNEHVIAIEDERGKGVVTYVFDEENYMIYKDFKVISDDAWRFTKTGQLRLFNTDIKLTWKIKLDKENTINIKTKYSPLGKFYPFTYELKADYLAKVEDFYNKEIAEKEREKQKKLEAQKKNEEEKERLEQEKLDAQKKAEEEKKRLVQEKLEAQQKASEEKLEAQQKAEEEMARLEQEKLEIQQKAEEEKKKLEEEKLKLQKEIEEQRKILEEEKEKLEQEKLETQKKLVQEKLYNELEPQFRIKCQKKMFNDLYKIGTPEYRECILNKGPEK